jgi:hypothetical protein
VETGLYVTFFTAGEPSESELPAVGPFNCLVVRQGALVADRRSVSQAGDFGGGRWIEAELELQRALGQEPGGARRPDMRIAAPAGVYLRFASFENAAGDEPLPELGPYTIVVVTRHGVEADGEALASRSATRDRSWVVLRAGGRALVGAVRPDIAFRTRSTNYHPRIHPARLVAQPSAAGVRPAPPPERLVPPAAPVIKPPAVPVVTRVDAPVIRSPAEPVIRPPAASVFTPSAALAFTPPAPPPTASTPTRSQQSDSVEDRPLTDEAFSPLRARLGGALRTDFGAEQTAVSTEELSRRSARRWAGFVLVGAMVLALGAFGALAIRGSLSNTSANVVGIGKAIKGAQFDYMVVSVSRAPDVSAARAQGVYVIVFVTATNRSSGPATLSPTNFRLIDGGGAQYPPLSESDLVYQSANNPGSPLVWMTSYAVGQAVSTPVIFDVDATLRGVQLMILEVPSVRVRLD